MVRESAKSTAPNAADARDTPSSRSQREVPASARNTLAASWIVKAAHRAKGSIRNENGEKGADCPFAASGIPAPFHRSRSGRDPSFHAIRTALAQGAICVAPSFRFAL
jgi:hypothetical protein